MPTGSATKKATIYDVASLAGVSIKTVSRVVNHEPHVQHHTLEKVQAAIDKLSYQPNTAARVLSGTRSFVIGLVYENPHEFSYIKDVLNGALSACENAGYSLLLRPVNAKDAGLVESIRHFALHTRLDGIIFPAPVGDMPQVKKLVKALGIPYALIAPKSVDRGAIAVLSNDADASEMVTGFIVEQGHRRIGFIKGDPDHGATGNRLAGYKRGLKRHGIPIARDLVVPGWFDFESGKAAARQLLSLDVPPSAIIASNDDMAAGAIYEAHERQISIPEDLSVIGFDDTPIASHIWPPLTTVRQSITEMAQTAAELLIRRLKGEKVDAPTRLFECALVVRGSTCARPNGTGTS